MQRFVRLVLAPLARLILRPAVSGAHRIPRRGPVLLAANHRAAVDTALLAFVTPRPVAFLGKAEYFTGSGLRRRLAARFLTALGYIPVDRDHAKAGLAALDAARKVRDATRAVDDPKLKDTLNTWADGFDTFAEALRTNTDSDPRLVEAANLIYGTADELRQACPEAFPADTR